MDLVCEAVEKDWAVVDPREKVKGERLKEKRGIFGDN
jgi:hypothetical protein